MKQFSSFFFAGLFSILLITACQSAAEEQVSQLPEKIARVEMKVEGMVCAMGCAKYIEDNVARQAGVTESKVDFKEGLAYFTYDANQLSAEELEQFIDDIHDGQYDATIVAQDEPSSAKATEDKDENAVPAYRREDEEGLETDVDEDEEKKVDVAQVVNNVQNISFPELLTYFMKRL